MGSLDLNNHILRGIQQDSIVKRILVFKREIKEYFYRGGETRHMKGVEMLVVSLRGVNLGFWSHLGCSGQNAIIFSREDLV